MKPPVEKELGWSEEAASSVSVIIPTLNEADTLGKALHAISYNEVPPEVIVVDAHSPDGTAEIARGVGVQVIECNLNSRGYQMNLGAQRARGEILLFLHADTIVPPGAIDRLARIMSVQQPIIGGAFARRYRGGGRFLGLTCQLATLRGKFAGIFLGDQGLFMRKSTFLRLGGFATRSCEDLELSMRMRREGPVKLLPITVISSPRRFRRRGAIRQTFYDLIEAISFIYRLGAPATSENKGTQAVRSESRSEPGNAQLDSCK